MNRTILSLIGAATALAAITGVASLTAGSSDDTAPAAKAATRLPVERSTLLCPTPTSSDVGTTTYTAFTPKGTGEGTGAQGTKKGTAGLLPAQGPEDEQKDKQETQKNKADEPVVPLKEPGKPVTAETDRSDAPALIGTADGLLA
ncbi:hypothetical protein AB4Z54_43475, partial [Streptomyces sp. MCAF7]